MIKIEIAQSYLQALYDTYKQDDYESHLLILADMLDYLKLSSGEASGAGYHALKYIYAMCSSSSYQEIAMAKFILCILESKGSIK